MAIFSEMAEKECVKERDPHSKAKIRYCAAILATAGLMLFMLLFAPIISESTKQKLMVSFIVM